MKRKRMSRRRSKKQFRRGSKTHKRNLSHKPMRGGWRI